MTTPHDRAQATSVEEVTAARRWASSPRASAASARRPVNQVGHEHPAADLVPRRDEDATKKGSSVRGGLGGNMVGSGSGWALSMLYIVRRRGRGGRLVKRGLLTGTTSRAGRESGGPRLLSTLL